LRGYFEYFDVQAPSDYYAYDIGAWHIVALNSNCDRVDCRPGSEQEQWLRTDLRAHSAVCSLAYMHHPRFSSGPHGGASNVRALWQAMYEGGVDLVLVGHDHMYERFAPQDPGGAVDWDRGIRQFTVGTGGASLYTPRRIAPNSEVRSSASYGVLKLTLRPAHYDWEFVPVAGQTFTDTGSAFCSPAL
jgi:hypothetical protein